VTSFWRLLFLPGLVSVLGPATGLGQIDPVKRELVQVGYNAAFQGHSPFSGYAFFYWNQPAFLNTNLALRLAIAPTYADSELGIRGVITPHTDIGIGVAGGGYADNYVEVRRGTFLPGESFTGYGGEAALSIYHLFNPGAQIPLNGVVRAVGRFSTYERDESTATAFQLPADRDTLIVRTGLRWGGREPTLFPSLAMELSIWYEGQFRSRSDTYGFGDRKVESQSHLFWAQALLAYQMPELKHSFYLSLTAGTSIDADRFSAYRLGALLPLVSEFPLSLPGYYYQEISAKEFVLLGANYMVPLDRKQRWNINVTGSTAAVDYLDGLEQPGNWHSGVGAGILFKSPSWKVMVGYAYGVDALRSHGPGAHSIGVLVQLDWEHAKEALLNPESPGLLRGLQQFIGLFGS
jgi:hypothetical protein